MRTQLLQEINRCNNNKSTAKFTAKLKKAVTKQPSDPVKWRNFKSTWNNLIKTNKPNSLSINNFRSTYLSSSSTRSSSIKKQLWSSTNSQLLTKKQILWNKNYHQSIQCNLGSTFKMNKFFNRILSLCKLTRLNRARFLISRNKIVRSRWSREKFPISNKCKTVAKNNHRQTKGKTKRT